MRYGSVCSGIEAASVAWHPLGWQAGWVSEIEAFPSSVIAARWPGVENLGDMTALPERILAREVEAPDILVGGTPCQAFSVAGLRGSLSDARGNLTLTFVRIANAIDAVRRADGREPAWIVWENVPGVLSVNDNAFGAFLGGLVGGNAALQPPRGRGWTDAGVVSGPERCAAWRVLDAQHFGLAQRRRRVFVLACGGSGNWAAADALLPVIASSGWHPAPSRASGQKPAPSPAARIRGGGGLGTDAELDGALIASRWPAEVAPTLNAAFGQKQGLEDQHALGGRGYSSLPNVAMCLNAGSMGRRDAESETLIPQSGGVFDAPVVHAFDARQNNVLQYGGRAGPLDTNGHSQAVCFSAKDCSADASDIAPTLRAGGHAGSHANGGVMPAVVVPPLTASNDPSRSPQSSEVTAQVQAVYAANMQVRRLTPRECERLQGFPDDYTLVEYRGKPAADGPRYKALGNSMAVPVMRYLGEQIAKIEMHKFRGAQ